MTTRRLTRARARHAPLGARPLLLCALLHCALLGLVQRCAAHGILTKPASRNWMEYLNNNYYWPDGLSAGGYNVVGQNGAAKWPYGRHSLCGDPADDGKQKFMKSGPVQEVYRSGQDIEIHVVITTNHYGRFDFRVCPQNAKSEKECIQLQRADGKGDSWDLPKVVEGSRFNGGALGDNLRPAEVWSTFTWFKQPHVDCGYWKYCSRFEGTPVYSTKWRLPQGFKCDKCILQWHYLTGHKCHPPCLKSDRYYPDCKQNPKYAGTYLATMAYCGEPGTAYPEEFWNCADVKIV